MDSCVTAHFPPCRRPRWSSLKARRQGSNGDEASESASPPMATACPAGAGSVPQLEWEKTRQSKTRACSEFPGEEEGGEQCITVRVLGQLKGSRSTWWAQWTESSGGGQGRC